jgi:hypothetical protein
MENIKVDIITIDEIKRLLYEGKILNAASIVAFYKALDFHNTTFYKCKITELLSLGTGV